MKPYAARMDGVRVRERLALICHTLNTPIPDVLKMTPGEAAKWYAIAKRIAPPAT